MDHPYLVKPLRAKNRQLLDTDSKEKISETVFFITLLTYDYSRHLSVLS